MYFCKQLFRLSLASVFSLVLITAGTCYSSDLEKIKTETITVTADKREKNIQEIPGSVSALSDIQIEDAGIDSIKDIDSYIPNFEIYPIYGAGGYQSIRGQNNMVYDSPSVGYYIDDVPSTFGFTGVQTSLFDIERIEVLRGPQGNLYGMNSAGGVVNIITKKPENTFRANASSETGSYNLKAYKAAISGAVLENKLFVGLSGSYTTRDSFIDEEKAPTRKEKRNAGRLQLRWVPTDNTDIIFTETNDNYYCNFDPMVVPSYDEFKIKHRGIAEGEEITDITHSLSIKHSTSFCDITSITAKNEYERDAVAGKDYLSDGENKKYRILEPDEKQFIQEIRFASNNEASNFQWIAGGFYQNGVFESYYNMRTDTGTAGAPTGIYTDDLSTAELETDTFSMFGQADYRFFEKITLSAGLRLDYDKKENDFYHITNGVVKGDYKDSTSWTNYSPKASLSYHANESVMAYLSIAKGYKSGGYNTISLNTADAASYDPEYAVSYETGIKTNWFGNRLIANLCAFYTKVDDIQITYMPTGTWEFITRNAAEATTWGIELESVIRPFTGFQLTGSFGFLDAEFQKHKVSEYEGNTIPFTPKYNGSVIAEYYFPVGIYLRGEGIWHGKSYFTEDNKYSQSEYVIANAKIGYEIGKFSVNFYADNIFDKTYFTIFNERGNVDKGVTGAPRTLGLSASFKF
ncbi:MAG: TonB-dependent receptor [Desulforegulaceae bacterium]|nr:TonB-dependent receptor [Desulforegulaceae bacterium]